MFERIKNLFGVFSQPIPPMTADDAVFIDVRTPDEFKTGHLPGAKNFPLDELYTKTDEIKQLRKPVVTVCRSGARSALAKDVLTAVGITAYDGGAWTNFKY